MERLKKALQQIDGQGYGAYKRLTGAYRFPGFTLSIAHVQGDPYADPSRLRARFTPGQAGFPEIHLSTSLRRRVLADFLGRAAARAIGRRAPLSEPPELPGQGGGKGRRGSGGSSQILIAPHGQEILSRNAVVVEADGAVEIRLRAGLPAHGRRIAGDEAAALLLEAIPAIASRLTCDALDGAAIERHLHGVEDQRHLREWLAGEGLVAFIADGSMLARQSGVDERPLPPAAGAEPFESPPGLAREVDTPHGGRLRGMGIPRGATLIVGGGFHGKSTLLRALEAGVYDHIPGDGRERVVTDPTAMKIRAEDGRAISGVDISPFIDNLPGGRATNAFSTDNASGSTSQAAAIVEAVEAGCRLLLVDEDTSATNFMIRDQRMAALVHADKEPITPFVRHIRPLFEQRGVSTILVMGGSGDYFAAADTVIMMDAFHAREVTAKARALGGEGAAPQTPANIAYAPRPRRHDPAVLLAKSRGGSNRRARIQAWGARGMDRLVIGERELPLAALSQLTDRGQVLAVGLLIRRFAEAGEPDTPLAFGLAALLRKVKADGAQGLDELSERLSGELTLPRFQELIGAVNRLRTLRACPGPDQPAAARQRDQSG